MDRVLFLTFLFCCISVGVKAQPNPCAGEGVSSTADIEFGTGNFVNEVPAVVGNPLVLRCVVTVDGGVTPPQIDSYVWTKNGVSTQYTEDMIQILTLASDDGGEYRCSAITDVPCITVESDITSVTTVPSVSLNPSSDFTIKEGERVHITCSVEGFPTPTIEWTRSTRDNTVVTISTNPVLILNSASVGDSGDYTCIAVNNRGNDRVTITVTVNEVTDPPTQPTTAPQSTSIAENGGGGRNKTQVVIPRPEPEIGFYIGIAVTAFICLTLTSIMIISVIIWAVRKHSFKRNGQEQYEEEEGEAL